MAAQTLRKLKERRVGFSLLDKRKEGGEALSLSLSLSCSREKGKAEYKALSSPLQKRRQRARSLLIFVEKREAQGKALTSSLQEEARGKGKDHASSSSP